MLPQHNSFRTFQRWDVLLLADDLHVLRDCLWKLAQGLLNGRHLVQAIDGGGVELAGFVEGLERGREAPPLQVGLAQTLPAHPVLGISPERRLQAAGERAANQLSGRTETNQ